jgi:hypothetical protein
MSSEKTYVSVKVLTGLQTSQKIVFSQVFINNTDRQTFENIN